MQELTRETFDNFVAASTPTLVDFWAGWCMPCKVLAPVLEELEGEMDGKASFGKLNTDDFVDVAQKYEITSIPTLLLFKEGKLVDRLVGVRPKQEIESALQKLF